MISFAPCEKKKKQPENSTIFKDLILEPMTLLFSSIVIKEHIINKMGLQQSALEECRDDLPAIVWILKI